MSMFNTFTNRLSRLHQDISKELEGALSSSPSSEPAPRPPSPLVTPFSFPKNTSFSWCLFSFCEILVDTLSESNFFWSWQSGLLLIACSQGPKQKLFDDLLMVELEQIGETNVPVVKEHWPSREVSSESLHKQVRNLWLYITMTYSDSIYWKVRALSWFTYNYSCILSFFLSNIHPRWSSFASLMQATSLAHIFGNFSPRPLRWVKPFPSSWRRQTDQEDLVIVDEHFYLPDGQDVFAFFRFILVSLYLMTF